MNYSLETISAAYDGLGGPSFKNRYFVQFTIPSFVSTNISTEQLNLFCSSASMPEHRVTTGDYQSVAQAVPVPYGFTVGTVDFTFNLPAEHGIIKIFDQWMEKMINSNSYVLSYKQDIVANSWSVWQLDKKNNLKSGTKLWNVMPVGMSSVDYTDADGEVQQITISIAYDRREAIK